jgi:general secretion pathway protein G
MKSYLKWMKDVVFNPAVLSLSKDHSFMKRSQKAKRSFDRLRTAGDEGFTLVELLVVIAILGLLMTIVALNVLPAQDKAMVTKAKADIAMLEQAVEQYRLDTMTYPVGVDGLQALRMPPAGLERPELYRRGGYIKALPADPWGRAYLYASPGQHGAFDIYSYGADGAPGGDGDNADVGNW